MNERARVEIEPAPAIAEVGVVALRRLPGERAQAYRRHLPSVLGRLLREAPGSEITVTLAADDDGIITAQITALGADAAELGAAIATELAPVAEVGIRCGSGGSHGSVVWPVQPATSTPNLGFVIGARHGVEDWIPERDAPIGATALAETFSGIAGSGLQVRVRVAATDADRFEVALGVLTPGPAPTLLVRSVIRHRFPGLVVDTETPRAPRWLTVDADDLPHALPLPVAGTDPIPGFYVAPAAPIPVHPSRSTTSDTDIRIGYALTTVGRPVPVSLTGAERVRHTHVLGRTGTGKSSAVAGIIHQIAAHTDEGMLVLDPHGTLVDRIVAELPESAAGRTVVIRCGDVDNPVPLSTLAETDPAARAIAIDSTAAIFQELFDKKNEGIVGPRFRERVAMGMRALCALHGETASFLDVPAILDDDKLMQSAIDRADDGRLTAWWRNDKTSRRSNEHGELVSWVNSKFEAFSSTPAIRAILGSGHNAIDFGAAMDDGQILLIDLSKAVLGEPAARLLGYLYLHRVWAGALRRTRRDRTFSVIVDEAHAVISGALSTILAEGRKFGLSATIAHQFLDQLDADLRPAIDGNVATTVAFRSAVGDAVSLTTRFGGLVNATTLTTLPDLTAIAMRAGAPTALPHTLVIDHNDTVTARTGDELRRHTHLLDAATRRRFVDPYRAATTAAAHGNTRIFATSAKPPADTRPEPGGTSFLDEWLAKRTEQAKAADEQKEA
ncbi:MAG: DUF87 domain-containing protein [Gordonia sp. (in: high G+C Gram-positive bacteria)]